MIPGGKCRDFVTIAALAAVLCLDGRVALAQSPPIEIGLNEGEKVGAVAIIAAIGVGIGVGVFLIVRHNHMLTGCTTSTASGLVLQTDGNGQRYELVGSVADIKPGERVRLSGKKGEGAGGDRTFLVEKLSKEVGSCQMVSSTP